MGYQVGVTPLQMVTAVSTVANGGHLLQPRVVRAFIKDGRRARGAAQGSAAGDHRRHGGDDDDDHGAGRRARAPRSAAQIDGYTIAGKTGTAAKLVNGHYQKSDYNASFVGFVPSRKPALDDPRRHRLAARQGLHRRRRGGADLQAHRGSVADLSRHRAEPQRAAAGPGRAPRPVARFGRRRRSPCAPPACCRRPSSRRATG